MPLARLRAAFLADSPPGSSKYSLARSFKVTDGITALKCHKWRVRDAQYIVLVPMLTFCLIICEKPGPWVRFLFAVGLALLCTIPAFSQFFLGFLPTAVWLVMFYSCRYIPPSWRPPIFVRVLPGLEAILYGGNLSAVLASSPNSFCDILAWIPYGLAHYGAPFVVSALCFLFGPPTFLTTFMFAFGHMNIIGLMCQVLFPNAPPWYQSIYGLQKANYGMSGSAGGLARIDKIIGVNLYSDSFGASPQVFGAFPSLHSGSAVMEALFLSAIFPKMTPIFCVYVLWIWWSTMYLTHHYFVDLIFGAILSIFIFYTCEAKIMPRVVAGKFGRWSYDNVEFGTSGRAAKNTRSTSRAYALFNDEEAGLRSVSEQPHSGHANLVGSERPAAVSGVIGLSGPAAACSAPVLPEYKPQVTSANPPSRGRSMHAHSGSAHLHELSSLPPLRTQTLNRVSPSLSRPSTPRNDRYSKAE